MWYCGDIYNFYKNECILDEILQYRSILIKNVLKDE